MHLTDTEAKKAAPHEKQYRLADGGGVYPEVQRPGERRQAEWTEFALDGAMWTISSGRMKRKKAGKESAPTISCPCPPRQSRSSGTCTR